MESPNNQLDISIPNNYMSIISNPPKVKTIAIVSLGCDKNKVDTEQMLYTLQQGGYIFTNDFANANIIIVNTCAFIQSARKEAIDNILQCAAYKLDGVCEKLIVTGCLPQKYIKDGIAKDLPEVDAFLGVGAYSDICNIIDNLYSGKRVININFQDDENINRFITTPQHYSYLKIAEGCDSTCTFCTIPSIRGKFRSRSIQSLVDEAKMLVDKGSKELILVAQDVTNFGGDINTNLLQLLDKLSKIDGIEWMRLMYCYPELVTKELITQISQNPKIAKYLDVPLQHISDKILKLMGRRNNKQQTLDLIYNIKSIDPDIAIRSTFMTGFPGETDTEYEELKDFLVRYPFDHAGFFAYSREEGTPSYKLPNQVPQSIKNTRLKDLYFLQKQINYSTLTQKIGSIQKVLYEDIDYNKSLFIGRSQHSAPDIDSLVYFKGNNLDVGNFYNIKITGVKGYDLIGKQVD